MRQHDRQLLREGTLTLKSDCRVDGDLHTKRLQVDLGARFNGNCKMIDDAEFEKVSGMKSNANAENNINK